MLQRMRGVMVEDARVRGGAAGASRQEEAVYEGLEKEEADTYGA